MQKREYYLNWRGSSQQLNVQSQPHSLTALLWRLAGIATFSPDLDLQAACITAVNPAFFPFHGTPRARTI